jgi:hypothetical protein
MSLRIAGMGKKRQLKTRRPALLRFIELGKSFVAIARSLSRAPCSWTWLQVPRRTETAKKSIWLV